MRLHPLTVFMASMMNVRCFCRLVLTEAIGRRRYNVKMWKMFSDCFNCMPICAVIDNKILCMHGGLSPDLHDLEKINHLIRPTEVPDDGNFER